MGEEREAAGVMSAEELAAMEGDYLVELAFQLYARACDPRCSEELHNRAMQMKGEVARRVTALHHEREARERAVEEEREACALIAEGAFNDPAWHQYYRQAAHAISSAIRDRAATQETKP
ncbi:MAG TPA: hypothetical protein VK421_06335 [Pyrinomonadaceae bacterium]|nr:hypothetical protein [Pyrinomonadaceae bacterium]